MLVLSAGCSQETGRTSANRNKKETVSAAQEIQTASRRVVRKGGRNMQYGVCCGPEAARVAARAGFDYVEMGVGSLLKPRENSGAFAAALEETRAAGLPCPVLNVFVPGDLKITGENVDPAALKQYVTTAFQRAQEAGVRVIVFGSGAARRIPDGFDPVRAHGQIVEFCRMLAPIAAEHGVTVAIEPLCRKECNVLNTVRECGELAREVNHPAVRLLVDSYHLLIDRDSMEDIVRYGDLLAHVHVATVPNRFAPGLEECDLRPFFDALAKAGYTGRVSIEGKIPDPPNDLPKALSVMKELERKAWNARS
jgi:sugar phosphate isomerase/epimerase